MKISYIKAGLLLGTFVFLSGCGSDSSTMRTTQTYSVKLVNITAAQPMSPMLVSPKSLFKIGESASIGLETLAEGGDNSQLLDAYSVSGEKLILPSQNDTISIQTSDSKLSVASMLVNTNDGFTGISEYDIASLHVSDSVTLYLNVYDAGTEENSETALSVAGLGGEGFNTSREPQSHVSYHSGIISHDDGLASSGLSAMHKFNNPVAILTITRID